MRMLLRGPVLPAAAAALAAGLSLALPAAAATAATAPPAATAAWSPVGAGADTSHFIEYAGSNGTGSAAETLCVAGRTAPGGLSTVKSVTNNCEYRVYLQYPPSAGHGPDCINPHTSRNIADAAYQHPDGARIGTSTAPCS